MIIILKFSLFQINHAPAQAQAGICGLAQTGGYFCLIAGLILNALATPATDSLNP
jgi:hypothetical protein